VVRIKFDIQDRDKGFSLKHPGTCSQCLNGGFPMEFRIHFFSGPRHDHDRDRISLFFSPIKTPLY